MSVFYAVEHGINVLTKTTNQQNYENQSVQHAHRRSDLGIDDLRRVRTAGERKVQAIVD